MTTHTSKHAVVIGAKGGIGSALLDQLRDNAEIDHIYAVARNTDGCSSDDKIQWLKSDSSETSIAKISARIKQDLTHRGANLHTIVITQGILHCEALGIKPEKRLASITLDSLETVFRVNCHQPMLWLKALESCLDKHQACSIAALSARVGSISDNQLGGWYSYRSSKAALNMMLKTYSIELTRRFPKTQLFAFHPGTTDTALSRPFQAGVPSEKLFSPDFVATRLNEIMSAPPTNKTMHYIDWDHQEIAW